MKPASARISIRAAVLGLALVVLAGVPFAFAVNPDEMLDDPILERRAREISSELRCLVCQNESIDDSNADLAADLRRLVRRRLVAGDSDQAAIDYIVARYGEFVLLKPRLEAKTLLLWGAPVLILLSGAGIIAVYAARRRRQPTGTPLSDAERTALNAVLDDRGRD